MTIEYIDTPPRRGSLTQKEAISLNRYKRVPCPGPAEGVPCNAGLAPSFTECGSMGNDGWPIDWRCRACRNRASRAVLKQRKESEAARNRAEKAELREAKRRSKEEELNSERVKRQELRDAKKREELLGRAKRQDLRDAKKREGLLEKERKTELKRLQLVPGSRENLEKVIRDTRKIRTKKDSEIRALDLLIADCESRLKLL